MTEAPPDPGRLPPPGTRFTVIVVLASLALSAPALLAGYWMDDYYFGSALIRLDAPFGFYEFGDKLKTAGLSPWWASPEFRVSFFRPLSSATLYLDFHVWNGSPRYAHLHSALWFVLLLAGALRLLRSLLSARAARWAAVIFALGSCHAFTVGWIAARHAVMGGAMAVWSVVYYLAWRRGGQRKHGLLAVGLLVLGLLTSETALAVTALVVAFELVGADAKDGWRRRLAAAAPFVGLSLAYLVLYKASGYGAYGSGVYADPTLHPGSFLAGVPAKTVSVLATFLFGLPTSVSYMPGMERVPLAVGSVALVLLGVGLACCWRRFEPAQRRQLRWLGLGSLLAVAPALASIPQGRSALLSFLAFAALAGLVVTALFSIRAPWSRRWIPLGTALLLCLGLVVTSPLIRLALGAMTLKGSQSEVKLGRKSPLRCARGSRVYLLNGGLMFSLQAPFIVAHHRGRFFRSWHQLTEPANDLEVRRAGRDSLVISGRGKPLVNGFMLRLMRPRTGDLSAGWVLDTPHLRGTVLEATSAGPTRVRFTIPHLDDPARVCLLSYDAKAGLLKHVALPPAEKSLTLKWAGPQP